MVVYVRTQGARVVKEGKHLVVKKDGDVYNTLFTYKLEQLVLCGNIELTHGALIQLLRNQVDTVFLTRDGRYLGRIAPPESKNVFLHKRQYHLVDDPEFGLNLARGIVAGKLANMSTLLMRIKRSRNAGEAGKNARQIKALIDKLSDARDMDAVRGYEGKGAALYFEAFRHGFIKDAGFRKRVRRPPTDPVNSVLSLLYTFLMNRVYAAVRLAGMDPYPGFLHSVDYGRYSLVLDLMEEFRPIIVDTLVFSLFNLKILQQSDFRVEAPAVAGQTGRPDDTQAPDVCSDPMGMMAMPADAPAVFDLPEQQVEPVPEAVTPPTGKYPVRLHPDAFQRVIAAFEKKLTTSFYYPPVDRKITYGDAIIHQAAHFRKVVEGEAAVYQPLLLK